MLDSRQRAALSSAYLARKSATTQRLVDLAVAYWSRMGSYNPSDSERFIAFITPRVLAGRANVAALTAAYLARVAEVDAAPVIDVANIRGTDDLEVYNRANVTLRTEISKGASFGDAVATASERVASIVATDMQLAAQRQTAASTGASRAFDGGFRRTLSGRENCAKCYIASTQRYHRGELMPIHPACDCGVEPLKPGENTGQILDPDRLEQTHDWVKGFTGQMDRGARHLPGNSGPNPNGDYADLLIVREHGEYGPTLSWRAQHFTGPADI